MATRELAWPLRIDASGGFAVITDVQTSAASHIRAVLATELGERVMRPDYGTPTLEHLFSGLTDAEVVKLEGDVSDAVKTWVPEVSLQGVQVDVVDSTVNITVQYNLNSSATQSVSMSMPMNGGQMGGNMPMNGA